jgi:hypothetical protein
MRSKLSMLNTYYFFLKKYEYMYANMIQYVR